MRSKDEALNQIAHIATEHGVSVGEIKQRLSRKTSEKTGTSTAIKFFAYLGGIFIFSGLGVYIGMLWSEMNSAERIIITLGSGIVAYVLALVAWNDKRYEKVVTPLLLIAALLQPMGLLVAMDELADGGNWRYSIILVSFVMLFQQALTFWTKRLTTLLFTSIFFACILVGETLDIRNVHFHTIGIIVGFPVLCLSYRIDSTVYRAICGFWYFVGGVLFFIGCFDLLRDVGIDVLFLGLACLMIYISTYIRSRTLFVVSSLATLSYIVYFVGEYIGDAVGCAAVFITLGFAFFGGSALVVKEKKRTAHAQSVS